MNKNKLNDHPAKKCVNIQINNELFKGKIHLLVTSSKLPNIMLCNYVMQSRTYYQSTEHTDKDHKECTWNITLYSGKYGKLLNINYNYYSFLYTNANFIVKIVV